MSTDGTKKVKSGGGKILYIHTLGDQVHRRDLANILFGKGEEITMPGLSSEIRGKQFAYLKSRFPGRVTKSSLPKLPPKDNSFLKSMIEGQGPVPEQLLQFGKARAADIIILVQPEGDTHGATAASKNFKGYWEASISGIIKNKLAGASNEATEIIDVATGKRIFSDYRTTLGYKKATGNLFTTPAPEEGVVIPNQQWNDTFASYSLQEKKAVREAIVADALRFFKWSIEGSSLSPED